MLASSKKSSVLSDTFNIFLKILNALAKILGIVGIMLFGCTLLVGGLAFALIGSTVSLSHHHPLLGLGAIVIGSIFSAIGGMLCVLSIAITEGHLD